jgi:hypothetical protein
MTKMDLKTTPIGDGRHLIELMIGVSVKSAVPCRVDDPADVVRACDTIKAQVPGIPSDDLPSRILEACRPKGIEPIPFDEFVKQFPTMREPIIDGILRRGETCNIIAASKLGKSFLAGGLAWCVATGRNWLSHPVTQSRVLIIDNELHGETLSHRANEIAFSMQIENFERTWLDVINLRGKGFTIDNVGIELNIPQGRYGLVIVDALYRWLPEGCSENDNAQMMRVYNRVDELANGWGAAVVIVHHSSKGDQSEKALTDVGAGAGSIARAADTHLAIRPHEQSGLFVLEAVTRSFKSPEPVSIQFDWPRWSAIACPAVLKTRKATRGKSQADRDADGIQAILEAIPEGESIPKRTLRDLVGMGDDRLGRLLALMVKDRKLHRESGESKRNGKETELYSRAVGTGLGTGLGTELGTDQEPTK